MIILTAEQLHEDALRLTGINDEDYIVNADLYDLIGGYGVITYYKNYGSSVKKHRVPIRIIQNHEDTCTISKGKFIETYDAKRLFADMKLRQKFIWEYMMLGFNVETINSLSKIMDISYLSVRTQMKRLQSLYNDFYKATTKLIEKGHSPEYIENILFDSNRPTFIAMCNRIRNEIK